MGYGVTKPQPDGRWAKVPPQKKGVRVYMRMKSCETSGKAIERMRRKISKAIGEAAAGMLTTAVTFEVEEVRPIVDMGQGWEKSI
jgi:hypothetical protein